MKGSGGGKKGVIERKREQETRTDKNEENHFPAKTKLKNKIK